MRRPGASRGALGALILCPLVLGGCSSQHELAAVIVGELGVGADAGSALDEGAPDDFAVVGEPWSGRWPFSIARWPLATSLRDFFAGNAPGEGRRVAVQGEDREPLWQLRQAVAAGAHGPPSNAVVVQDGAGDRYLLAFPDDD
jgi:hypothetical protein